MSSFSLVLPCYNEGKSLKGLVNRVMKSVRRRNLSERQFKLILVENGSKDNSRQIMAQLKEGEFGKFLKIVVVKKNRGYGYGLFQGLKGVKTEYAGWTHADEQCDPEDAFKAWELCAASKDRTLVKGVRSGRALSSWMISRGFEFVVALILQKWIPEINAQPKVFKSSLLTSLDSPPFDFAFDLYVLLRAKENGIRIHSIPVKFPPRKHGESNWSATFQSKVRHISRMIEYVAKYRFNRGGASMGKVQAQRKLKKGAA